MIVLSLALRCESCGMPMAVNEEHGAQDPNNPYCIHCTDLNGKLLPFEKKFEDLVNMAMKTRWMSREEAERSVRLEMAQMPAWKDKVPQAAKPA
ncbi:MAG TPA: zinc ribbon domain-containing protein [Candidatus Bathyarchaeia archaeon]|nr:zinc ribbon domain-containing protein [Candidatus Bathyarchaeia archaeon]